PVIDGRKLSKSYDKHIPLFLPAGRLKKLVRRIPTDSTPAEAPNAPDSSAVFPRLSHLAHAERTAAARQRREQGGRGWADLNNELFQVVDATFGPMRERADALMEPGSELDGILADGAARARERAPATLARVRSAIGIA